ncbi:hypothetical protein Nepgr_028321 [Nepenthes gracilis]|uniref:Uncharacterized protein n=1 Tax=Nepenthes gracilis TaxID=150966 RepID=A0AAD3TAG3_NEPGR|nr:hypothetical protein Nepgr_028321 [Nepenthes gracilis]
MGVGKQREAGNQGKKFGGIGVMEKRIEQTRQEEQGSGSEKQGGQNPWGIRGGGRKSRGEGWMRDGNKNRWPRGAGHGRHWQGERRGQEEAGENSFKNKREDRGSLMLRGASRIWRRRRGRQKETGGAGKATAGIRFKF